MKISQTLLAITGVLLALSGSTSKSIKIANTDFSAILAPDANILHPIFGLALYTRGQKMLVNLYQHGNPDHPLIKIIHTLFHHDTEDERLRPSATEANVAYGFGPYEIGWLLALIVCKPELFLDANLYNTNKKHDNKSRLDNKLNNELNNFIHTVDLTHKNRVAIEHPNRKKSDLRGTSVKKLLDFSLNAVKALEYSAYHVYDPEFVLLLFNMFAVANAKNKSDLFDFVVNGFANHATAQNKQNKNITYLTPYGKELITKTALKKDFLEKTTSLQNIKKIVDVYFATMHVDGDKLPQTLLFPGTAYLLSLTDQLAPVSMLHIAKYDNAPDCTEAAILHLVTHILFNHQVGLFNETDLPKKIRTKTTVLQALKLISKNDPNNNAMRTVWFEFLANRQGVGYKQPGCSVSARAKNVFNLLKELFCVNADSWETLGQSLSSPQIRICFTGPDLKNEPKNSHITFKKIYLDGSAHETIIRINRDVHAAILDSKFIATKEKKVEENNVFTRQLLPIGLPPALYGVFVSFGNNRWRTHTIPKKNSDPKQLFLTLSKNIEKSSFFELMQLAHTHPKIKELIKLCTVIPQATVSFNKPNAAWLISSNEYKKPMYWNTITNNSKIFLEEAFFQGNYPAINYLLDTILPAITSPGSTVRKNVLKDVWGELLNEYRYAPYKYEPIAMLAPMPMTYRHNPEAIKKILYKLITAEPSVLPYQTKTVIAQNIRAYGRLAQIFIDYDNNLSLIGRIHSYLKPHMLYIILENAIADANKKNRQDSLDFLLGDHRYVEERIFRNLNLTAACAKRRDGFILPRPVKEIKRTKKIKKLLVSNYKKQKEYARDWAVVPYVQQ